MYIVASTWEVLDGKLDEFVANGNRMRKILMAHPGIESIQHFSSGEDEVMVIVGYSDEDSYNRLINDPEGPFVKGLKDIDLEKTARWKQSWRGNSLPGD